jgi:hypothetical protein
MFPATGHGRGRQRWADFREQVIQSDGYAGFAPIFARPMHRADPDTWAIADVDS